MSDCEATVFNHWAISPALAIWNPPHIVTFNNLYWLLLLCKHMPSASMLSNTEVQPLFPNACLAHAGPQPRLKEPFPEPPGALLLLSYFLSPSTFPIPSLEKVNNLFGWFFWFFLDKVLYSPGYPATAKVIKGDLEHLPRAVITGQSRHN